MIKEYEMCRISLNMGMKYCWIVVTLVLSSVFATSKEFYRSAGTNGDPDAGESNKCPLQCRCIALSHLGYREMAERWSSLNRMHSSSRQVWRGTEAPIWREDPNKLRGRDVVCMGLNKVPKPLPAGTAKLTLYGDSSTVSDQGDTNSQITTILERSFRQEDDLRQLKISGNNLHILYPYIFRNLPNLENLALQSNNITHISAAAFYGLYSLKELRLSDNMIRYLSPNVFIHLINTEWLYLNGNKLSVLHNALFSRLGSLQHLDLSRNNFRTFSDHVFDDLVNLQELLINENQIIRVRARWFRNLFQLKNLEIRANAIKRMDISSFKTLSNLLQLSLSANAIKSISNGAFRNLSKLESLDLSTNDINRLEPDCFAGLDSLDSLDLSTNRLYFINNKTFTNIPTLRQLKLSKNAIKDIEEAALHPLSEVQELDLSHNKLRRIRSNTLSGLQQLKEVNLEYNLISDIDDDAFIVAPLNQLSKITWLSLQYNRIKLLGAYSLYGLPHMKFLNVGHNKIRKIHKKAFYTLSGLQNLILNDNRIHKIEDGTFTNLRTLYFLTLENNRISEIYDNTFTGVKKLEDLNIVSNGIRTLGRNSFRHFINLKRLNLQDNLLATFDFDILSFAKGLTHVDLSNNIIFSVNFPLQRTHIIRNLILSGNRLQTLSSDLTNVLATAGNVWLPGNPLSCDCRLQWLAHYSSEYRLRLLGSRDTLCKSPLEVSGKKIMELQQSELRCNPTSLADKLICQRQEFDNGVIAAKTLKQNKGEIRKWHVTFYKGNSTTPHCNGVLIRENWVLTTSGCFNPTEETSIVTGKKQLREAAITKTFVTNEYLDNDSSLQLIRLYQKSANPEVIDFPCILSHAQYHKLNLLVPEGVYTTRSLKNKTKKWNLVARRGRTVHKCNENGYDICLRIKSTMYDSDLIGSPLMVRHQGAWYLSGIGTATNKTVHEMEIFAPLWPFTQWIATVMHEIDSNCRIRKKSDGSNIVTLCEKFVHKGITERVKLDSV